MRGLPPIRRRRCYTHSARFSLPEEDRSARPEDIHCGSRRINLLIPNIDLKHFFGGYITKLNLARCLAEAGFNVRLVIVDVCDYLPSVWRRQLQSYDGLEELFD